MRCRKCAKEISDECSYCPYCGTLVSENLTRSKKLDHPDSKNAKHTMKNGQIVIIAVILIGVIISLIYFGNKPMRSVKPDSGITVDKTEETKNSNEKLVLISKEIVNTNGAKEQWKYAYDYKGNLLEEHRIGNNYDGSLIDEKTEYEYDSAGNMTAKTYYVGNTAIHWYEYTYDDKNQLISERDENDKNTVFVTNYEYNNSGHISKEIKENSGYAKGYYIEYVYDTNNNLTQTVVHNDTESYLLDEYAYDNDGNKIREISYFRNNNETKEGKRIEYEYDQYGNLSKKEEYENDTLINSAKWEYNENGNLLTETTSKIHSGEYETKEYQYTYNSNGLLTTKTCSDGDIINYTYDENKKLIKEVETTTAGETITTTYEYEPLPTNSTGNEYIFPNSDTEYLTDEEVSSLTADELALARNEIIARHGRIFTDESYKSYFESKSWYKGTIQPEEFDANYDNELSDIEKANIELIKKYEKLLTQDDSESQTQTPTVNDLANTYYGDFLRYYKEQEMNGFVTPDLELINPIFSNSQYFPEGYANSGTSLYYAVLDLANDGIPELLISDGNQLYGAFGLIEGEGQVVPLFNTNMGEFTEYQLCTDNMIRGYERAGNIVRIIAYYRVEPHSYSASCSEAVYTDMSQFYFANLENGNWEYQSAATEQDFREMETKYPINENIEWLKLSDF